MADKSARRRMFAALLEGEPAAMLDEVERQYGFGVDPLALLRSIMELTHRIALAQVGGEAEAQTVVVDLELHGDKIRTGFAPDGNRRSCAARATHAAPTRCSTTAT